MCNSQLLDDPMLAWLSPPSSNPGEGGYGPMSEPPHMEGQLAIVGERAAPHHHLLYCREPCREAVRDAIRGTKDTHARPALKAQHLPARRLREARRRLPHVVAAAGAWRGAAPSQAIAVPAPVLSPSHGAGLYARYLGLNAGSQARPGPVTHLGRSRQVALGNLPDRCHHRIRHARPGPVRLVEQCKEVNSSLVLRVGRLGSVPDAAPRYSPPSSHAAAPRLVPSPENVHHIALHATLERHRRQLAAKGLHNCE